MYLLDTDHVVQFQKGTSVSARRLGSRLDDLSGDVATTIITAEEIVRGWLAAIRRSTDPSDWIFPYAKLQGVFTFFGKWNVIEWSDTAVNQFKALRKARVRVPTMDMKIASIALAIDATLLTANTIDFERVPGLRFENWLSSL